MKEQANKIQAVINTLQGLNITATAENLDKLLGSLQVLAEVRNFLNTVDSVRPVEPAVEPYLRPVNPVNAQENSEVENGNDHS